MKRSARGLTILVALAVAVALLIAGLSVRRGRPAPSAPLSGTAKGCNVLLITLDTTRADCLGCYGHPTVKTPNIDALASEGARFTQCTSAAPITLPSHTSIMTATYPFEHRARNNGRFVTDDGNVTLAERLKAASYHTAAEVGAYVLDAAWGLNQGFDSYRSHKGSPDPRGRSSQPTEDQSVPADDVCDRAIEWLGGHAQRPFFLWVHFFDPHQPCEPPERFRKQYDDAYFGEIAFVDEQIGRLRAELKRLGVDERTVIVLTADHGEGRMEHQELTHTYFIYDTTLHVPLILHRPGVIPAAAVYDPQTRTVDIAPTILDLLGLEPLADAPGTSLLPVIEGRTPDPTLPAYSESIAAQEGFGYARLRSLRAGGWKFIHAPTPELYHVAADRGETKNLAAQEAQRVAEMREQLENVIAVGVGKQAEDQSVVQLDAAAAARLSALGYIGGHTEITSVSEIESFRRFEGPDPKDRVAAYNEYMKARAWAEAREPAKAEAILRTLTAAELKNPAFFDLWAAQLRTLGRLEECANAYRSLLEIQPRDARSRYTLGAVLGELGRYAESVAELRQAATAMPEYPEAHAYLALGLVQLGQAAEAADHYRAALRLDPAHEDAAVGLGELLAAESKWVEAVEVLRAAANRIPDGAKVANNLAWYLATAPSNDARSGEEAVRHAETVVRLMGREDPNVLDTLAAAYAEAGRFPEAAETVRNALKIAGSTQPAELISGLQDRLALYEQGKPYHQPP